jgi:beta-lactamase superfamily II metal-dependent hydrolase
MATKTHFAGYPSAVVYKQPDGKKPIQHLLWGDWLRLKDGKNGPYCEVHARGVDGWMHQDFIQKDRILEVVFVDIGQGDGCLLVTPDDKHILIDAGIGDNMYRFLRWRYGGFKEPWEFESAVISHPDADHYAGFDTIFDDPNVTIKTIYHNGIMERKGKNSLGAKAKSGKKSYLTNLIQSTEDLHDFLSVPSRWKKKKYPMMIEKGLSLGKSSDYQMLSVENRYMRGYGQNDELTIQVLGPVVERDRNNKPRLKWFGSTSKTKNGHSIVLRIIYGNVRILLGGDLNIPSENLLLGYHTGLAAPPASVEEERLLIEAARRTFEVDIAKSCHHGSADFSSTYLLATNPIATVISSGDNEPHSHPRADTLGTIGSCSRGIRPMIFSTELARSAKEAIKHPYILQKQLKSLQAEIDKAPTDTEKEKRKKQRLIDKFNKQLEKIERSIAIFGAINLRTDGEKVVIAQKIEQPRSKDKKWDIYQLETSGGLLQYISKY